MQKTMKLMKLELRNFKGVRQFTFEPNGGNAAVFGDNATGKTTIFDAFIWLLFDKDSTNKKDFEIKTLDEQNKVMHGLEHEVEGTFQLNGKVIALKKVYAEKWTKKRGSVEQEFTGHTTDYFIDGVPVKKKEYMDFISGIVDEDVFKLLTSPSYFNEQLHWNKRRETLIAVCGDVSDEDVIASSKSLDKLPDILNGRSIESHRKVIASRRSEINKEIEKIPVRIDEVQRSMPDTSGLNADVIQQKIDSLKSQVDEKESEVSRIQSGGEITAKQNQIREIQGELLEIKNNLYSDSQPIITEKQTANHDAKSEIQSFEYEIKQKQQQIKRNDNSIEIKNLEAETLRNQWSEINPNTFSYEEQNTDCPSCGQALPEEKLQAARDKAEAEFNRKKSEQLESINKNGKALVAEVADLTAQNVKLQEDITSLQEQIDQKRSESEAICAEIDQLQANVKDVDSDPTYIQKKQQITSIEQEITDLRVSVDESVSKVRNGITTLKTEIQQLEQDQAKFDHVKKSLVRIDDLKKQQRTLSDEYEKLEHELYMTEEFIRCKVNMLEEKINSKFKYAKFKLFKQNINGGVEECCDTLYNGVPYGSGLNNAARINVGLDIINTLSDHHAFSAPIFVDNAEAVTKLIDIDAQVISLVVSEADKKLRVEGALEREAV